MPVLLRTAIALLVLGPLALVGMGVANMVAFNSKAAALERTWSATEAAGVTPAQLQPARDSLDSLRDRRILFLPFSAFSGALLIDPFGEPERKATVAETDAMVAARQRARDDLAHLKEIAGPGLRDAASRDSSLASAHRLTDYVRLARAWEGEADQLDQLGRAAGGLSNGQPKDVADGISRLQGLVTAANDNKLAPEPAGTALTHAQAYLQLPYAQQLAQHDTISGEVKSAGDTVQHRVDTRIQANQLVGRLPDLMSQASKYGVGGDYTTRANQAKDAVTTAETSGDDTAMDTATASLKQAMDRLSSAVTTAQKAAQQAALAAGSGCIDSAPAQLIVIHLATQKLVAYDKGCPFLTTLITSGRPAVRTDRGTFTIHRKEASHLMHSPWPQGDPLWYPDTVVHDAMLFVPADGSYLHSAEWEPASAYGPGSENGPYASHGCVHVQNGPLTTLYNWAQVGATVMVTD